MSEITRGANTLITLSPEQHSYDPDLDFSAPQVSDPIYRPDPCTGRAALGPGRAGPKNQRAGPRSLGPPKPFFKYRNSFFGLEVS